MRVDLNECSARHPASNADAAPAVRRLSVSVNEGEQVAVIGPSGSGKTTLLHLIACVLRPSEGVLKLNGVDPWTLSTRELQIRRGELFLASQVPPLPPRQRVVTSVLAGRLPHESVMASLKSLFYPTGIAVAEQALAQFDLSDKLFERVDRLSGGERQRVALARALVSKASLFLIDEPLSALDPTHAEEAITALVNAASERRATFVCTLHQVDTALKHFPRIIGLRDGVMAFDLAASAVTPEILRTLYANKLDELTGAAPEPVQLPASTAAPLPAVMHCR